MDLAAGLRVAAVWAQARCTGFQGGLSVALRRPQGWLGQPCRAAAGRGSRRPAHRPDARHAGKPHFLLRGLQKTAELGARAGHPRGAGRMAEGKAGGAAGLFAKQMQKKFSRAQEKVGTGLATCRSPLLSTSGGPRHCEGAQGAQEAWTEEKGLPLSRGNGRWAVQENRQT